MFNMSKSKEKDQLAPCRGITLPEISTNCISIVFRVKLFTGMKSVLLVINEVIISPGDALTGIFLIIDKDPSAPIVLKHDKFGDLMYMFLTGVNTR